jgi:hypothetical protein
MGCFLAFPICAIRFNFQDLLFFPTTVLQIEPSSTKILYVFLITCMLHVQPILFPFITLPNPSDHKILNMACTLGASFIPSSLAMLDYFLLHTYFNILVELHNFEWFCIYNEIYEYIQTFIHKQKYMLTCIMAGQKFSWQLAISVWIRKSIVLPALVLMQGVKSPICNLYHSITVNPLPHNHLLGEVSTVFARVRVCGIIKTCPLIHDTNNSEIHVNIIQ